MLLNDAYTSGWLLVLRGKIDKFHIVWTFKCKNSRGNVHFNQLFLVFRKEIVKKSLRKIKQLFWEIWILWSCRNFFRPSLDSHFMCAQLNFLRDQSTLTTNEAYLARNHFEWFTTAAYLRNAEEAKTSQIRFLLMLLICFTVVLTAQRTKPYQLVSNDDSVSDEKKLAKQRRNLIVKYWAHKKRLVQLA